MFKFLKAALSARSGSDEQTSTTSTTSSASNGSGIDIRVGRPPRSLHVPRSALRACPILRQRLVQGSSIINVDPVVFEVIIDYLSNSSVLGKFRARNPLERLIGSSDMMLKLAKAWHIADMLDLISLQNKLVDTYRGLYLRLLN